MRNQLGESSDRTTRNLALFAAAMGVVALGAVAIGALAIRRLLIGRMTIAKAQFGSVDIQDLCVKRVSVTEVCNIAEQHEKTETR